MALNRNLAWMSALLAAALVLLIGSSLPFAPALEAQSGALVSGAAAALGEATRPLTDVIFHAGQIERLSAENARLRGDVAGLEVELAALREQALATAQVSALVEAVGSGGAQAAEDAVAAAVVARDPDPARAVLTLDRGTRDGIAAGQPVLGPGAVLVGLVVSAEATTARVRLLSDPASDVAVLLQRSRTPGVLAGGDPLRLEFVGIEEPVDAGDLVLTSALGARLPRGLPIGRVATVEREPQQLFAAVEVAPLTDYRRLEHVLVLTTEAPPATSQGDSTSEAAR